MKLETKIDYMKKKFTLKKAFYIFLGLIFAIALFAGISYLIKSNSKESESFLTNIAHNTPSECSVPLISRFDPWHSGLCTCPPKLTFNPYTGCDHRCLYCYATSYIPNFQAVHPKKEMLSVTAYSSFNLLSIISSNAVRN